MHQTTTSRKTALLTLLLLVSLSVLSWLVGEGQGIRGSGHWIIVGVAAVKAVAIFLVFMEMLRAHVAYKLLGLLYIASLASAYLLSAPGSGPP